MTQAEPADTASPATAAPTRDASPATAAPTRDASPATAAPTRDASALALAADEPESVGRKAGRGLRWSLFGTAATKLGAFGMSLVLARLLTPDDFGIYAIALAATGFVMHINDVGIIAATVQWRGRLADMAPTASGMAIAFSVIVYGVFWLAAPWYAGLAGSPEATPVVRLLTVIILIDGVTAVRSAALMREFRQDKLILANVAGLVVNATTAISLAAAGAGAYSFAAGQVASSCVIGALVLVLAKVPFRLGFDREVAKRLMRFGVPLAASLGVEAVLMNADYVIVGNVLGATALGFYLLAFNVSSWAPSIIGTAVRYVSVAGFSRLSEKDDEALSTGVARSVPLLMTGVIPIVVLVAALAGPLVFVLYGGQWQPAVPVLRLLVILTVVRMLTAFAVDIMTGAGATRWALWLNLGWAVALVPALIIGTRGFGATGAAAGHAVAGVLVALPLAGLALHRIGVRLRPIAPALVRPALAGALAGVVALMVALVCGSNPYLRLFVAGGIGGLTYIYAVLPADQRRRYLGQLRAAALSLVRRTILRRRYAHASVD